VDCKEKSGRSKNLIPAPVNDYGLGLTREPMFPYHQTLKRGSLINKEMVDTIRTTGKTSKGLPEREEIFKEYAHPYDREAENAIITGCQIFSMLPHTLCSLSRIEEV